MIEIRKARKDFGEQVVLRELNLKIPSGQLVFVIGKSGTGKSVLLKLIVGLLRLTSGEIWMDGQKISELSEKELYPIRKNCGYVFQQPALLDSLTVYENLAFGLRAHRIFQSEAEVQEKIGEALAQVHFPEKWIFHFPPELSFGLQKRVSIARALVLGPRYLLFDEPTTGLDPVLTNVINELISRLSRDLKMTSIVVSHDLQCALRVADRIVLLEGGEIVLDGDPEHFFSSSLPLANEFVREAKERMGHA